MGPGAQRAADRAECRAEPSGGVELSAPGRGVRVVVAVAAELDDAELERRLFPPLPPSSVARPEPDWVEVHRELKGKGVTLELLWDEYKAANPDGYQYSTFCQHYRRWRNRLDVVMRQDHRAGEKLFVDYAGKCCMQHFPAYVAQ